MSLLDQVTRRKSKSEVRPGLHSLYFQLPYIRRLTLVAFVLQIDSVSKQGSFVTGVLSAASTVAGDLFLEVTHEAANDTLI